MAAILNFSPIGSRLFEVALVQDPVSYASPVESGRHRVHELALQTSWGSIPLPLARLQILVKTKPNVLINNWRQLQYKYFVTIFQTKQSIQGPPIDYP